MINNAYIRFLNLMSALDRVNPYRCLDHIELVLLTHILRPPNRDNPLLIGDLLELKRLGSQATLRGRIQNLVALEYIQLITDKKDHRKKIIVPTKLGHQYVEFMSECLEKAMRS